MKTVTNKKVAYTGKDWNEAFTKVVDVIIETDYFKLILDCCKSVPQGGYSYDDIKSIDRVVAALKDKTDSTEFEDSDFTFIQTKVSGFKWAVYDSQFGEFMDYIKDLK